MTQSRAKILHRMKIWLQLRSKIFFLRGFWSSNTSYQTLISVQKLFSVHLVVTSKIQTSLAWRRGHTRLHTLEIHTRFRNWS